MNLQEFIIRIFIVIVVGIAIGIERQLIKSENTNTVESPLL